MSCSSLERELGPGGLSPLPKPAGLQRGSRLCVLAPVISFQPESDLAPQRGTPRCMATPTLLENTNP